MLTNHRRVLRRLYKFFELFFNLLLIGHACLFNLDNIFQRLLAKYVCFKTSSILASLEDYFNIADRILTRSTILIILINIRSVDHNR